MNRRFGGMYRLHYQGDKNRRARNNVSSNYQLNHSANEYYGLFPASSLVSQQVRCVNKFYAHMSVMSCLSVIYDVPTVPSADATMGLGNVTCMDSLTM
jgi:hypothetical protein